MGVKENGIFLKKKKKLIKGSPFFVVKSFKD